MHMPFSPRSRAGHPRASRRAGFTLVELLVVIGIIALLISILLPALGAAQRSGRSIKCLSALRQIGTAFNMYSISHKGYWPVAVHTAGVAAYPLNPSEVEIRWVDLLAPFITNQANLKYDEINKVRQGSVLWGCPEWAKSLENDDTSATDKLRPGYGMQYTVNGDTSLLAYVNAPDTAAIKRRYVKQVEWTKPTDRGLIADSTTHIINTPDTLDSTKTWYQPKQSLGETSTLDPYFKIDGSRHAPSGTTRKKEYSTPYINMLYCDGHAATVSVRTAWNSLRNPGKDTAGN